MTAFWLLLALALGALAQGLKATGTLTFVTFWVNLAAVIILARCLPSRYADAAPPDSAETGTGEPPASAALLVVAGGAVSVLCSLALVITWDRCIVPVLFVGPPAIACLAIGLDEWFGFPAPWKSLQVGTLLRRRDLQVLLLIVLVGVGFRFISLGSFPPMDGIESIEETQAGTGAMQILQHGQRPWEWPLSWYLAAASFQVFGYSMYALRVPVMVMGCLTLVPFYCLLREFTAAPAALFATALLAVSRWHVQVSWYNDNVFVPLFPMVVLLYLMVRTQRVPRPSLYLLTGVLSGYLLYDYAGFRVMPAVVFAFYLGAAWRAHERPAAWRQLAVLAFGFALLALPLARIVAHIGIDLYLEALYRATANKDYYTSDLSSFVTQRLQRIAAASDAFTATDHEAFLETLNPRGAPLLDPFTSVLFVLGFGTTLLQPRGRHHAFFAITFLLLTAGATVLVPQLDFRRLAILIPFVFIFIALLADKVAAVAAQPRWRIAYAFVLTLVVGLAGAYNFHFLFRVLARDSMVRTFHRDPYLVPAFYLRQHYGGEYVVLVTTESGNFFLPNDYDWLKPPGLEGQTVTNREAPLPIDPPPPTGRDVLLLVEWGFPITPVIQQVPALYPGATCEYRKDPDGPRWRGGPTWDLGVCRIPASAISH
jgi:hypothetical protein